jgi:hypothetical protein
MRPELLKAILAMLLGGAGTTTVPVGNTPVPVSALTNLLSSLAGQASEAYNNERAPAAGFAESTHYGSRSPWSPRIDLASEEARAGALLNLLRESEDGSVGRAASRRRRQQRLANLAQALRMVQTNRATSAQGR